ncbi:RNA polymerase sigma factor [Sphingobacterium tabacisoli]|uniref:RNA polymerase sigma factor n=1 Tax=Sphingobacterium tabacisoli TaxID=2044855 RepID=A0ABW5L671_9SPHI|nr:RNA polymerase sigma-70 factor [Sphingobacterium tabacisoli]
MTQVTLKDQEHLFESFKNGDEKSFAHIFDIHYRSLCYFATPITQDALQAEDIVADCMYKLWQQRATFKTLQNIKAFLYISCRNACLNHLRNLKRRNSAQELYLSQLESSEDTILYQIIETEVLSLLDDEIESLPEKCRAVFKLIYIDNKKTDEIAAILGISDKTVRGHKARAIELLKTQLLKKGVSSLILLAFLFLIDAS